MGLEMQKRKTQTGHYRWSLVKKKKDMTSPDYRHADYLSPLIRTANLKKTVAKAVRILKQYDFDSVAFRGLSGALIAPILAVKLDKHLIAVRKSDKVCHSIHRVEGNAGSQRYIIVDDFVSTGETVQNILEAVKPFAPYAVCLGVLETSLMKRKINWFDGLGGHRQLNILYWIGVNHVLVRKP